MEQTLKDLIPNISKLARDLKVSTQTIRTYIELDAIPPKRVAAMAIALGLSPGDLLQYARVTHKPVKVLIKGVDDLDDLMAAYEGREHASRLSERSIKMTLSRWGDRFPLLYTTLKALGRKEISLDEASMALGITKSSVNNLRQRYGVAPGALKSAKKAQPLGPYKQNAKEALPLALDVIAGRMTAVDAGSASGMSVRTLHRYLAPMLRPQTLNEISKWSLSFRHALAWEVEHKKPRRTVEWQNWAKERNLVLKKHPKWPKEPGNWREVGVRRLAIAYLSGEKTLEELAVARHADPVVIRGLIRKEVESLSMSPFELTMHHQIAVAEVLLALNSHYRTAKSDA
ncbi:MAG: hypothetical protein WC322_05730 [Candidatus Paceibacterota bacterium]|jgi:DNA-binding Xre family transcriptional regulator